MTNGITLEEILEHANLSKALSRVEANRGVPGVDRMGTDELRDYISAHPHELTSAIIKGTYRPSPVLRVSIPKEEPGKFRELGIPTVRDRLVQQAIAQVLNRYYDLTFSDRSYGFRPGKSAQDAIMAVTAYAEEGYVWAVDMDLEKFFDKINHSKMVQILSERISDGRVISLIHRFLRADVQTDKGLETRDMGAPQGGPLSPILANILLDKLDKELEKRGLRFARYADDMIVLCKSKRAATRVFESLTRFIEKKLLLRVNRKKSKIVYVGNRELKFLGYGFAPLKGRIIPTVHFRSKAKFKDRIRKILHRNKGQRLDQFTSELRTYLSGWSNYFGLAAFLGWARGTDEWIRRRIRMIYWKRWKRVATKYKALRKLGASKDLAKKGAGSSKSYWRVAGSPVLSTTLTNEYLKRKGWTWLALIARPVEWHLTGC